MEKEVYDKYQIEKKRTSKLYYGVCFICGESKPEIMKYGENHHIDGNKVSNYTIRLCPNCHYYITERQNELPPEIRSCLLSLDKAIFALRSQGALLELCGKRLIEHSELLERCRKLLK